MYDDIFFQVGSRFNTGMEFSVRRMEYLILCSLVLLLLLLLSLYFSFSSWVDRGGNNYGYRESRLDWVFVWCPIDYYFFAFCDV